MFDFFKKLFGNNSKGIDVTMSREVMVDSWIVSISLNLMPVPVEWYFRLIYKDPEQGRQFIGEGLLLKAPINSEGRKQIHEWLRLLVSQTGSDIPHWTLFRDVIIKIEELEDEEKKAREGHELVKKQMAKLGKKWG